MEAAAAQNNLWIAESCSLAQGHLPRAVPRHSEATAAGPLVAVLVRDLLPAGDLQEQPALSPGCVTQGSSTAEAAATS